MFFFKILMVFGFIFLPLKRLYISNYRSYIFRSHQLKTLIMCIKTQIPKLQKGQYFLIFAIPQVVNKQQQTFYWRRRIFFNYAIPQVVNKQKQTFHWRRRIFFNYAIPQVVNIQKKHFTEDGDYFLITPSLRW